MSFDQHAWCLAALGVLIIVGGVAWVVHRARSNDLCREHLVLAFELASRVQSTDPGEPGKICSLFGPRSWQDR